MRAAAGPEGSARHPDQHGVGVRMRPLAAAAAAGRIKGGGRLEQRYRVRAVRGPFEPLHRQLDEQRAVGIGRRAAAAGHYRAVRGAHGHADGLAGPIGAPRNCKHPLPARLVEASHDGRVDDSPPLVEHLGPLAEARVRVLHHAVRRPCPVGGAGRRVVARPGVRRMGRGRQGGGDRAQQHCGSRALQRGTAGGRVFEDLAAVARGRGAGAARRQINTSAVRRAGMSGFDEQDMKILDELVRDGNASVADMAKSLGVNESFVYSRIRRLKGSGLLKRHTITVDDDILGIGVRALVGISRNPELKDAVHASLMSMPEVRFVSEVMGRFDIMVGIVAGNHDALHPILIDKIGRINGVEGTETFVELQRTDRDASFLDLFKSGMLQPRPAEHGKKGSAGEAGGGRGRRGGTKPKKRGRA